MSQNWLTDEQVEQEIERLNKSPLVALARKEKRIRERRRQYLYNLRALEKKGMTLAAMGWSPAMLEETVVEDDTVYDRFDRLNAADQRAVEAVIRTLVKGQEARR